MDEVTPRVQYAALPFRVKGGRAMVMLVTTRDTGRWIIPKGWPKRTVKPRKLAAREAYEEAGILGRVGKRPCGAFRYTKRLDSGESVACEVQVYPFEVRRELAEWPEMGQRRRLWTAPAEAALLVRDPDLAELLRSVPLPSSKGRRG